MKIESKFIYVNDAIIHYNEYNPNESDHTILFIHGNSSSSNSFVELFTLINRKTRLIGLDLNGHNNSEIPQGFVCSIENYIVTLVSFIEELDIHKFTIVGHSIGGHISIEASEELSNKLIGLICICSPPFNSRLITDAFNDPSNGLVFKSALNSDEIEKLSRCFINYSNVTDSIINQSVFNISTTHKNVRPEIGGCIISGNYKDEVSIVQNSNIQMHFIQGVDDKFINTSYYKILDDEEMCNIHMIEKSSHYPHVENTEAVAKIINSYLKNVPT